MDKFLLEESEEVEIVSGDSPSKPETFKDEMNFAEFPLASLNDKNVGDKKTIHFVDTIFDKRTNLPITRKLTISASDEYGLPKALDEEVVLGLIQLSNRQGFADRRVHFSMYELIKLLGWKDSSDSYNRITESLKRWLGVTLYYDKAWRDKEDEAWVNESFHILDNLTLYDRERKSIKRAKNKGDPDAAKSYFVWNEKVFKSFKDGNLKEIDLDVYKNLKSPISKRIYRFLDKRFYLKRELLLELKNFAHEHIGISRASPTAELKRTLHKPIIELEQIGFILPLPFEERFIKAGVGHWRVRFTKGGGEAKPLLSQEQLAAFESLQKRGVTPIRSSKLVRTYSIEKIAEKIALHDWLKGRGDKKCSANPSGFLVAAIQNDYPLPANFLQSKEEAKANLKIIPSRLKIPSQISLKMNVAIDEKFDARKAEFSDFWTKLSEEEKDKFEAEAVKVANVFSKTQYFENREKKGKLFEAVRQNLLENFFLKQSNRS